MFITKCLTAFLLMSSLLVAQAGENVRLLVMGDSISAAYGMDTSEGWVQLLEKRAADEKQPIKMFNASISGETTAGGLRRLPAILAEVKPDWVILELGANDGLRGLSLHKMRENLASMIALCRAIDAQIILVDMDIPPSYGKRYFDEFKASYAQLAKEQNIPLLENFVRDVAVQPMMMQADGLHPNIRAQPLMMQRVWDELKGLKILK